MYEKLNIIVYGNKCKLQSKKNGVSSKKNEVCHSQELSLIYQ